MKLIVLLTGALASAMPTDARARFQGSFRASWGNKAPGGRGGR